MLQIYIIHLIYLTFNPDKYKFCFLTSSPIFPSVTETVTPKGSQGLICRVHLQSTSSWSYWGFSRPAAMVTDIKLLLCSWQSDTSLASRLWLFAMSLPLPKAWLLPWACPCPFRRHACFLERLSLRLALGQLSPSHIQAGLTSERWPGCKTWLIDKSFPGEERTGPIQSLVECWNVKHRKRKAGNRAA